MFLAILFSTRLSRIKKAVYLCSILFFSTSFCQSLHIGYWSSWKTKCGIAVYTEHIVNALQSKGHKATVYPHAIPLPELLVQAQKDQIKLINIQYEPALMPTKEELIGVINKLKQAGIKIVITVHREDESLVEMAPLVDRFIFHKDPVYLKNNPKVRLIPMAIPVYLPSDVRSLRQKYGFKPTDIIISTFGFLTGWKEYPVILELLVPWLKADPRRHIQILASFNNFGLKWSQIEDAKIKTVIERYAIKDQVTYISDFLSQDVISERLALSDLGYLWAPMDTQGSSAASKEFVTARLPLVVSDSSHYHDINVGVLRTPKEKTSFLNAIRFLANRPNARVNMRRELEKKYQTTNYNFLISKHIVLFQAL